MELPFFNLCVHVNPSGKLKLPEHTLPLCVLKIFWKIVISLYLSALNNNCVQYN